MSSILQCTVFLNANDLSERCSFEGVIHLDHTVSADCVVWWISPSNEQAFLRSCIFAEHHLVHLVIATICFPPYPLKSVKSHLPQFELLQPPNVSNPKTSPAFFSWRRLYAALAGVEEPFDAFLQPPPRHNLSKRLQPSAVPLQSNAPDHDHPRHLQLGHCGALSSTALLSQSVPSLLSPLDKTEPPAAKRSRPGSHGCPPAEEVTARVAACPNDTSKPAACSLRVGQRDLRAGGEGRVSEPAETQQRGRQLKTWKMRLKEGIATGRKPSETFVFAGQSK